MSCESSMYYYFNIYLDQSALLGCIEQSDVNLCMCLTLAIYLKLYTMQICHIHQEIPY